MDKNTLEKIKSEKALDWQESAALEQALESQAPLKGLIASLEDPSASLAWRSSLNEKLLAQAKVRKRKSLVPWIGGLTAAAACVSALFIMSNHKPVAEQPASAPSFEAALTNAYTQTASKTDVDDELASNLDAEQDL